MNVSHLSIPDVLLFEPLVFEDERGLFFESFREDIFRKETSLDVFFVQENHSPFQFLMQAFTMSSLGEMEL